MARGLWSGAISFGLINIPVEVMSAKGEAPISFRMLDKTDNSPIGYKQYNKATGKPVQKKNIVKGYEYEKKKFVIVTEKDFEKANPKAARTIDLEDFVNVSDLDPLLFERPYYLVPGKNAEKGYVLLKRTLEKTEKAAIARFVMHGKQHLVAVMSRGKYLILETLRYAHEIKEVESADFLKDADFKHAKVSDRELKMAESLVEGMTAKWEPSKYKDTYQDDLMKRIKQKIRSGDVEDGAEADEPPPLEADDNVVDLMPLLQKSLKAAAANSSSSSKAKKSPPAKKTAHKRAAKEARA